MLPMNSHILPSASVLSYAQISCMIYATSTTSQTQVQVAFTLSNYVVRISLKISKSCSIKYEYQMIPISNFSTVIVRHSLPWCQSVIKQREIITIYPFLVCFLRVVQQYRKHYSVV